MSDSVKKWHEMQEEKKLSSTTATSEGKFIYESPDGGITVTKRSFNEIKGDKEVRKQAFTLLVQYPEEVVRMAYKILNSI